MTLDKLSSELNRIHGEIPIIFRDDDASELIPELQQLIDIFNSAQIPLHIAAIPAFLSETAASFLIDQQYIEIGQHGYSHKNHATIGLSEFSPNRSYTQQFEDIRNGRERMQQLFGDVFQPIFTPPFHGFNETTLRCIQELDFKIFSSEQQLILGRYAYSFKEVSINLDPIAQYEPQVIYKSEDTFLTEIMETAQTQGYLGFMLHHRTMSEDFVNRLQNLLYMLRSQPNVKFYHLSQYGQELGSTPLRFPTKARAIKYNIKKLLHAMNII